MTRFHFTVSVFVLLGALAGTANAMILTFEFSGVATSWHDPQSVLGLEANQAFNGEFEYDSSATDTVENPGYGLYYPPSLGVTLDIGTVSISGVGAVGKIIVDNLDPRDELTFWTGPLSSGGISVASVEVSFSDGSGLALNTDALPDSTTDVIGFAEGGLLILKFGDPFADVTGTVTVFRIVPEPSVLALLACGCVFQRLRGRRQAGL